VVLRENQAEMVLRVRREWQVPLDLVVLKEKWDQVVKTMHTETGNSARGRI